MSQITKPIALDETLQDVVTAIQGITQGGMIVSTGNVGSATQPVYIDGGVPMAAETMVQVKTGWQSSFDSVPNKSGHYIVHEGGTPYGTQTGGLWHCVQVATGSDSNPRTTQIATRINAGDGRNEMWMRTKFDSTWTAWNRIGGGITTGNATLNSTYIDSGSASYVKSGNVVVVNMDGVHLKANVPTGTTLFSNLPKNAISRNRLWIDAALDTTHDNFLCNMTNSGILALAGAQAMPTGRYLYGSFTYITND